MPRRLNYTRFTVVALTYLLLAMLAATDAHAIGMPPRHADVTSVDGRFTLRFDDPDPPCVIDNASGNVVWRADGGIYAMPSDTILCDGGNTIVTFCIGPARNVMGALPDIILYRRDSTVDVVLEASLFGGTPTSGIASCVAASDAEIDIATLEGVRFRMDVRTASTTQTNWLPAAVRLRLVDSAVPPLLRGALIVLAVLGSAMLFAAWYRTRRKPFARARSAAAPECTGDSGKPVRPGLVRALQLLAADVVLVVGVLFLASRIVCYAVAVLIVVLCVIGLVLQRHGLSLRRDGWQRQLQISGMVVQSCVVLCCVVACMRMAWQLPAWCG